jgi:hypothetical protein
MSYINIPGNHEEQLCRTHSPKHNMASPGPSLLAIVVAVQRTVGEIGINQDEATAHCLCMATWSLLLDKVERIAVSECEGQPDWRAQILLPMMEDLTVISKQGSIHGEDFEFVLYVSCVVVMAYDILRFRSTKITAKDEEFVLKALTDVFYNKLSNELRRKIWMALDSEIERLVTKYASDGVINAVLKLQNLLTQTDRRLQERHEVEARNSLMPSCHVVPAHERSMLDDNMLPSSAPNLSMPVAPPSSWAKISSSSPVYAGDVHVQIFLKQNLTLQFPCVRSVFPRDDKLVIETYTGLRIRLEDDMGVMVSGISTSHDSMKIFRVSSGSQTLSATVIVPPGFRYRLDDVVSIGGKGTDGNETVIETSCATFRIGNSPYRLERNGRHVMVKNVCC